MSLNLQQLLVAQMIARIYFKYKHVIHAGSAPTVRIESNKKYVNNNEQRAAIQLDGYFPVEFKHTAFNNG